MKKLIFLLTLNIILNQHYAYSQNNDLFFSLKKVAWKKNNKLLDSIIKLYPQNGNIYFKVPLTFWVYTDKKGFGPGPVQIKQQLQQLNKFFSVYNKTGIQFYIADIKIIHTKHNANIGYLLENFILTSTNHISGTINIHIVNNIKLNFIAKTIYLGGTYNPLTKAIIITKGNFPTGLAHEIGHYFGLLHPHRNWNKGKLLAESVSRTQTIGNSKVKNCEARGDYLCDTQAQPDLWNYTDDSCHYTGHLTDPWGNPYKPQTDNIMSYLHNKHCRKHFTPMQIAAMLYNIEHSKYGKYWKNSKFTFSIQPDKFEPDNNFATATILKPDSIQYHTFNQIFTKKRLLTDLTDFIKILSPYTRAAHLIIKSGKYAFPQMLVTFYDQYQTPIKSMVVENPQTIKLPQTQSPVLYIKLKLLNPSAKPVLFDYQLKLISLNESLIESNK